MLSIAHRACIALLIAAAATLLVTCPANAQERASAQPKKVQVYIMLGQSNMLGYGAVGPADKPGTLEHVIANQELFKYLKDADRWKTREDVRFVHVMSGRGGKMATPREPDWLTVPDKGRFGPELGFGFMVGDYHDAPVLLLKSCIGNRSLGWDLLPPGSERFEYTDDKGKVWVYAGYKDSPMRWEKGTEPEKIDWYAGKQYDDDVAHAKAVLENLADYYPGHTEYEIAGFVWWQGHKDQNPAHAQRYEANLINLIAALRKDFNAPNAKFVLATIAFNGQKLAGHGLTVAQAQLAMNDYKKYPAHKGTVRCIDARPFWREKDVSPSGQGYHYNWNAETYMRVGEELGKAAIELHKGK